MGRTAKANLIAAIVLAGFFASVVFHYRLGVYQHLPYPHNTFLFLPGDRFADFYGLLEWNSELNPYLRESATSQYPLLNLVSYALSTVDQKWSLTLYNTLIVASMAGLVEVALRSSGRVSLLYTFIITLLTYPFLFAIDRGNFESLLCVFLLAFSYSYQRGHEKAAAFFLACTIAMKLFPIVLLVLFVADKKYKLALQAVLWTVALTLLSVATFEGGVYQNLAVLLSGKNLASNQNVATFTGQNELVQRGVSLFSALKIYICAAGQLATTNMAHVLRTYAISMALVFLLLVLYVIVIESRLWKKATVLVFAMLLFPQISADYKLLHVLIPLLLFINAPTGSKLDWFYAAGFATLLIPKDYVLLKWVYSDSLSHDISIGMIINPLLMLAMMLVTVVTGLLDARWSSIRYVLDAHWRALIEFLWPFRRTVPQLTVHLHRGR